MTLTRLMPTPPSTSAQRNASRPLRVRTSDSHTALSCRMFQPCTPSRPFPTVDAGFSQWLPQKVSRVSMFYHIKWRVFPTNEKKNASRIFFFFFDSTEGTRQRLFQEWTECRRGDSLPRGGEVSPCKSHGGASRFKRSARVAPFEHGRRAGNAFFILFFYSVFFLGGGALGGGAVRKIRIRPPHRHCFPCDPVLFIHLWRGFPPFDGASRTGTRLC